MMSIKANPQERTGRRSQLSLSSNITKNQRSPKTNSEESLQKNAESKKTHVVKPPKEEEKIPLNVDRITTSDGHISNDAVKNGDEKVVDTDEIQSVVTGKVSEIIEKAALNILEEMSTEPKSETVAVSVQPISDLVTSSENKTNEEQKVLDKAALRDSAIVNENDDLEDKSSPSKILQPSLTPAVNPAATSTPGKIMPINANDATTNKDTEGKRLLEGQYILKNVQIYGRRSIHEIDEFSPSKLGTYRPLQSELDNSSLSTTSMNATIGSDIHNNTSFSFFGRGRKRDHSLINNHSVNESNIEENQADRVDAKRARVEKSSFMSVVSSPFTKLRTRFAKTSLRDNSINEPKQVSLLEEGVQQVVVGSEDICEGPDKNVGTDTGKEAICSPTSESCSNNCEIKDLKSKDNNSKNRMCNIM